MKRKRLIVPVSLILALLLSSVVAARLWIGALVEQAVARPAICWSATDRRQHRDISTDTWQRDRLIAQSANAAAQDRPGSSAPWHLRGIAFAIAVRTLWLPSERDRIFGRLKRNMRDCPA